METEIYQQIFEQFKKTQKILIALPAHLSADNLASGLALFLFLQKLQKDVELVSAAAVPEALRFLPAWEVLKSRIDQQQSLVIEVDTVNKPLAELSYQTLSDKVSIFLKSKNQAFLPEDLSFVQEHRPTDLVVVINCPSLSALGPLFDQEPDLFYETTKINIDNQVANEFFGAINMVDLTATSIAEILADIFEKYETQLVDEDIATALLAGIITKTNSFQHAQTTPRAFLKASSLIALGGRQQEVIKFLFKSKPLSLLKLWGRALARLKVLEAPGAIYSVLNVSDFEKAGSSAADLLSVLKEFVNNVGNYHVVAIVAEPSAGVVEALVALHPAWSKQQLLETFGKSSDFEGVPLGLFQVLKFEFSQTPLATVQQKLESAIMALPPS